MPYSNPEKLAAYCKQRYAKLKADPARHAAKLAEARERYRRSVSTPGGLEKLRKQSRARYAKFKKRIKDTQWRSHVKCRYGMSAAEYTEQLAVQNGACEICRGIDRWRLAVDHCHRTGRVRGLLCSNCNRGIGHFKDSPELLSRAIAYLEQPK